MKSWIDKLRINANNSFHASIFHSKNNLPLEFFLGFSLRKMPGEEKNKKIPAIFDFFTFEIRPDRRFYAAGAEAGRGRKLFASGGTQKNLRFGRKSPCHQIAGRLVFRLPKKALAGNQKQGRPRGLRPGDPKAASRPRASI